MRGAIAWIVAGAIALLVAPLGFLNGWSVGPVIASAGGVAMLFLPITDRLRWCEIERRHSSWSIVQGIGNWRRIEREVSNTDILCASIASDGTYEALGAARDKYLRIELVARAFAGAETAVEIGRRMALPEEVLQELCAQFDKKSAS